MTFRSVARTHTGSVRSCNEDAVLDRADAGLWAVSDGMGGHKAGDVASALVVDTLKRITPVRDSAQFLGSVEQALSNANEELYSRGAAISPDRTAGATVVVLAINGGDFLCVWAGDSRLYRFREGRISQLTHDHRYVQALIDAGKLSAVEAENHPQRSVITRAVGVENKLELERRSGRIEPGDVFLLTSDGVTGTCRDDELAEILSVHSIDQAADRIVERCLQAGAPDNLSLILVEAS